MKKPASPNNAGRFRASEAAVASIAATHAMAASALGSAPSGKPRYGN
jgi:hypothetical protein